MNKVGISLIVATALWMQLASAKTLKVLMVGNSFSQSVLEEWPQCSASAGDTLDAESILGLHELPHGRRLTFTVEPRNCYGAVGVPLQMTCKGV